jgi:hypothetical protein
MVFSTAEGGQSGGTNESEIDTQTESLVAPVYACMQPKIALSSGVPIFCLSSMQYLDLSAPKAPPSVSFPNLAADPRPVWNEYGSVFHDAETYGIRECFECGRAATEHCCNSLHVQVVEGRGKVQDKDQSPAKDGSSKSSTPMFCFENWAHLQRLFP